MPVHLRRLALWLTTACLLVLLTPVPSGATSANMTPYWPDEQQYSVGSTLAVVVDYDTDSTGQLRLEVAEGDQWVTQLSVAVAAGQAQRRFAIDTDRAGSFTYRFVLDATGPPPLTVISGSATYSFKVVAPPPPQPVTYASAVAMSAPKPARTSVPAKSAPTVRGVVTAQQAGQGGDAGVAGRQVRVLLDTPRRDVPLITVMTDADGRFTARLPHDFTYRGNVYATVLAKTVERPGADTVYAAASSASREPVSVAFGRSGRGSKSEFSRIAFDATWNPCRPLTYRVNMSRAPRGFVAVTKKAMKLVYQATGLRFVYAGSSSKVPGAAGNQRDPRSPLVIAFSDARTVPILRGDTHAAATYQVGGGMGEGWVIHAGVTMEVNNRKFKAGFGPGKTQGEILLHELGHAVGLDHVDDRDQIMYPLQGGVPDRFEAGDLAGLAKVGVMSGCASGNGPT